MAKTREKRRGEYICTCSAYSFPHRMGGGSCIPQRLATEHFEKTMGSNKVCRNCHCLEFDEKYGRKCTVVEGVESWKECEIASEFVRFNEVKCKAK